MFGQSRDEEVIEMDNVKLIENESLQQTLIMREQDKQLESLYGTARNIHEIAATIGNELEDQKFDEQIDRSQSRLSSAMKKVTYVIKKNEDNLVEFIDDAHKKFGKGHGNNKKNCRIYMVDENDRIIDDCIDDNKIESYNHEKTYKHDNFPNYQVRLNEMREPKLCDTSVKQYSGYLDAPDDKHFFFWFFESRNNPSEDPIVLWLNGGPGCSSLTGLFLELGPCSVKEDGSDTIYNPHSWTNNANSVSNTLAAATDVYAFLQIFFKELEQYAKLDFHIAGESYAGHYIPVLASEINKNNKKLRDHLPINLSTVMIGNGLVDPLTQYKYYPDMACNSSYGPVLDQGTCDGMRNAYANCASMIKKCYDSQNVFVCLPASLYCNRQIVQPFFKSGKNPYDIRRDCENDKNNLCYPILDVIESYLDREDVKTELGVDPGIEFKTCNMRVNFQFQMAGDWMKPYHKLIPGLLDDDIRVLIYAGDADYMCNWIGSDAWVKELEWSGKESYNLANETSWIVKSTLDKAGTIKHHEGLAFLRIYEAGHMVPYDQPINSLDFFNRWLWKDL
nr:15792_t:CDS:10 [Entrophospora candida]